MVSHNVLCCTLFRLYFTCRRARLGTFWEGVGLSSAWTNTEAKVAFSGKIKTFKRKANVYKARGSAWVAANHHNVRQRISFFFCARAPSTVCFCSLQAVATPISLESQSAHCRVRASPRSGGKRVPVSRCRVAPPPLATAGQKLEFMRHGGFRLKNRSNRVFAAQRGGNYQDLRQKCFQLIFFFFFALD